MVYWIKRFANIMAFVVFFLILFSSIDIKDPLSFNSLGYGALKGIIGAFIFWIISFIIGDIIFKSIVHDITKEKIGEDAELEGGIIQRIDDVNKAPKVIFKDEVEQKNEGKKDKSDKDNNKK